MKWHNIFTNMHMPGIGSLTMPWKEQQMNTTLFNELFVLLSALVQALKAQVLNKNWGVRILLGN